MEVPEFFLGSSYFGASDYSDVLRHADQKPADQFAIDDLLDFSNNDDDDAMMSSESFFDNVTASSFVSSSVTVSNSSPSPTEQHFSDDLCVPCEDLAELEWLSNFVEDSFSAENDFQSCQLLSATTSSSSSSKPLTPEISSSSETTPPLFPHEMPFPGKARSKRSRGAPGDWTTRLLHVTNSDGAGVGPLSRKNVGPGAECLGRKCLHCATEKTPQWRTGPMGPKTLCNACGVRYKSGRLVPEYRPAASPTFLSTKHSNSHRKVLELRRQKEIHTAQHHQFLSQHSVLGISNGGDDFLIHHHGGPDFRHLI